MAASERAKWMKRSKITDKQWNDGLGIYQGGDFEQINSALRGGRIAKGSLGDATGLIDDAFLNAPPLGKNQIVYRTAYFDAETAESVLGGVVPRSGVSFVDRGFMSTSLKKQVWEYGVADTQFTEGSIYNFRIRVPKSHKAIRMDEYMGESEILLNRNHQFRVVGKPRKMGTRELDLVVEGNERIGKVDVFEIELEIMP